MATSTAYISSGMELPGTIGVNAAGTVAEEAIKGKDIVGQDLDEML